MRALDRAGRPCYDSVNGLTAMRLAGRSTFDRVLEPSDG